MVRNYVVYGVDAEGKLHELTRTPAARKARAARDAEKDRWTDTEVSDASGPLSIADLNDLADKGHRYA